MDLQREWAAPDICASIRCVEDTAHARLRRIRGTKDRGILGYYLGEARWAVAQACCQSAEGVQTVANESVDSDAVGSRFVLGPLQGAEESSGTGYGHRDKA